MDVSRLGAHRAEPEPAMCMNGLGVHRAGPESAMGMNRLPAQSRAWTSNGLSMEHIWPGLMDVMGSRSLWMLLWTHIWPDMLLGDTSCATVCFRYFAISYRLWAGSITS